MRQEIHGSKYKDTPLEGDKIICLENYCEYDLVNGEIGYIPKGEMKRGKFPLLGKKYENIFKCGFITDYSEYKNLIMDPKTFLTGEPTDYPIWVKMKLDKCDRPLKFDYGYAITCHKAQGSQWNTVMVFDEYLGDKEFHRKWLYTAITRACKKLIIIK